MNLIERLKDILTSGRHRLSVTDWAAVEFAIREYIEIHENYRRYADN